MRRGTHAHPPPSGWPPITSTRGMCLPAHSGWDSKRSINSLQKKSESIEWKENEDDRTDVMITEDEDQISTQDRKIQIITKKLELLQNKLHLIQLHRETSV